MIFMSSYAHFYETAAISKFLAVIVSYYVLKCFLVLMKIIRNATVIGSSV